MQEASAKQAEKGKDGTYTFYGRAADDKVSGKRFFDRFEDERDYGEGKPHGVVAEGKFTKKEDHQARAVAHENERHEDKADEAEGPEGEPQRSQEHMNATGDNQEPKKAHEERLKDTDVGAFRYGLKKLGEVEALHADSKR